MKLLALGGLLVLAPAAWAQESVVDFCPPGSVKDPIDGSCTQQAAPAVELPDLDASADQQPDDGAQRNATVVSEPDPDGLWSSKPKCIRRQNETEKYCVFTDSHFADGRGISFMVDADFSQRVLSIPALKDPDFLEEGANDVWKDPPYEKRPIPGKGIGLVATRRIQRGELVMRTTPLLLLQDSMLAHFEQEHVGPFLDLATRQLGEESAKLVHDCKGHFGGHHVADVVNTNAFAVELPVGNNGAGVGFNALLPESGMMNHDCRPNTHYWFDTEQLIHYFYALRTIIPGEEITDSYIDIVQTSEERKNRLRGGWGFECVCSACRAHKPVRDASDIRVLQIQRLGDDLRDRGPASPASATNSSGVQMAELLVDLYKMEGMNGPIAEGYAFAALEHASARNKYKAMEYAYRAIEAGLLYSGAGDTDVKSMYAMLANVEDHWAWGVRDKRRALELQKKEALKKKTAEVEERLKSGDAQEVLVE